jgi:queuine/archaeosine tRNA-ribosyltransferase
MKPYGIESGLKMTCRCYVCRRHESKRSRELKKINRRRGRRAAKWLGNPYCRG